MRHFDRFHQIVFWPLEVYPQEGDPYNLDAAAGLFKEPEWMRRDTLDRGTTEDPGLRYAEYVYFHPFVQRFLYPGVHQAEPISAFRLLCRTDVKAARVRFETDEGEVEEVVQVDRVHLYLFQPQIAILCVEVSIDRPISRGRVLQLQDQFRRVYAPFYWEKGGRVRGGYCPIQVEWLDAGGQKIGDASSYGARGAALEAFTNPETRRPAVSAHWQWLIEPMAPLGLAEKSQLAYTHIEDDRMPSMCLLQHPEPFSITRSDLTRICFLDEEGGYHQLPYSSRFLENFETRHLYQRFWDPDCPANRWMNTLYLGCGYGFTLLGKSGVEGWSDRLRNQFRHHYFQLGLLAHFHRAALLRFSRRMGEVAAADDATSYGLLRQVRLEFAEFVSTLWFHEVSNQDQGRELFEFWTKHLGNEALMDRLLKEAAAVDEVLSARYSQRQTMTLLSLNERIDFLTKGLYWFAGLTLVVAALDMDSVREFLKWFFGRELFGYLTGFLVCVCAVVLWLLYRTKPASPVKEEGAGKSGSAMERPKT